MKTYYVYQCYSTYPIYNPSHVTSRYTSITQYVHTGSRVTSSTHPVDYYGYLWTVISVFIHAVSVVNNLQVWITSVYNTWVFVAMSRLIVLLPISFSGFRLGLEEELPASVWVRKKGVHSWEEIQHGCKWKWRHYDATVTWSFYCHVIIMAIPMSLSRHYFATVTNTLWRLDGTVNVAFIVTSHIMKWLVYDMSGQVNIIHVSNHIIHIMPYASSYTVTLSVGGLCPIIMSQHATA